MLDCTLHICMDCCYLAGCKKGVACVGYSVPCTAINRYINHTCGRITCVYGFVLLIDINNKLSILHTAQRVGNNYLLIHLSQENPRLTWKIFIINMYKILARALSPSPKKQNSNDKIKTRARNV